MRVLLGLTTEQANAHMAISAIAKKYGCKLHNLDFEKRQFELRGDYLEGIFQAYDEIMEVLDKMDL